MSRRNPSPVDLLVQLPWQVSAVLAVVAFVSLRWVFPSIDSTNPILHNFIQLGAKLAWVAAFCFGVLAALSAFQARRKRALLDSQRDLESIRALSWKQFELLVGEAYRRQGYSIEESLGGGPDGGIDVGLSKGGQKWIVQCKRWKTQSVGAPVIREMFGLLNHHQVAGVIVVTSGHFTREAIAFAEGKPIELIDGPALLQLVKDVQSTPSSVQESPVLPVPTLSPVVPSCPKCGGTMVERVARKGTNAGATFWGCTEYPQCRGVRNS
jgi:restriction system protein